MAVRDTFILEDKDAIAVLRAYWPPRDDVTEDQRFQAAMEKRAAIAAGESKEAAEVEVRRLIEWDKQEQALLGAYGQIINAHAIALLEALAAIQKMSEDRNVARANGPVIWRPIEGALHRAAAISRIFDFSDWKADVEDKKRRRYREKLLRLAFGIDDKHFIPIVRNARNMVEHFEEHFDKVLHDAVDGAGSYVDLACLNTSEAAELEKTRVVLRWYDVETRTIHVFNEAIRLDDLISVARGVAETCKTSIFSRGRYHIQFAVAPRDHFQKVLA